MKRKAISLLLVIMLGIVSLVSGCSSKESNGDTAGDTKDPIKIGGLTSLSGVLQDYGTQMQRGFMLGLEYATDGTMEVAGRKIEVIWEDTTTVPDVARERALKLLDEDKVDLLVGPASSADAAALLGLAEEYEKILMIEPAAADFLTGANWNRYIFRTGRNTAQDANAMAAVITHKKPGAKVATLAPDSAFGHAGVAPFVDAIAAKGGELIAQEFPPADTTDFTPFILRIREEKPDYLFVIWAGANNPWGQLMELDLQSEGIEITTGAPEIAALKMMTDLVGMHGFTVYYHGVADNPVNKWLVEKHQEKYNSPPDIFTSGGMASAMALVTALEKTEGDTDTEKLIETLRGMEFDSPTGKRWFREEDHQAMQPLFEIKLEEVEGVDHVVPTLIRVIPAEEVAPPIAVPADAKR
ncbi:substrate-binding domain-containing protein [Alkaliphilus serpentinus]|uniref:ABC transporter substrate-binding protein n=1 Tax=Alkaliphilus serpentinus TaxID=1482731 RepID=A0A833M8E1_9FIRM|nr:substrate-binding domain-containing protein [Alkaliphilus serpentinus]KAB3532708.1 ABC transporter substrate-binding protein [Alkaliphilus serpentinus]